MAKKSKPRSKSTSRSKPLPRNTTPRSKQYEDGGKLK